VYKFYKNFTIFIAKKNSVKLWDTQKKHKYKVVLCIEFLPASLITIILGRWW